MNLDLTWEADDQATLHTVSRIFWGRERSCLGTECLTSSPGDSDKQAEWGSCPWGL